MITASFSYLVEECESKDAGQPWAGYAADPTQITGIFALICVGKDGLCL